MAKLTDQMLRKMSPGDARQEIKDDHTPGLWIEMGTRGDAKWVFRYRDPVSGKRRRRQITAPHPYRTAHSKEVIFSLAEARTWAAELNAKVRNGIDPREHKDKAAPRTIHRAIELTIEADRERELRSVERKSRRLHLLPQWVLNMPPQKFKRGHAKQLLVELKKARGITSANRSAQALSSVFTHCLDFEWVEAHPFYRVKLHPEPKRSTFLDPDEIRSVWRACEEVDSWCSPMIQLLTLTGCRRSEIMLAHRDEIHGDWLFLAADRVKTGAKTGAHIAFLGSPLAKAILERLPKRGYLFPRKDNPDLPRRQPFWGVKKIRAAAGIEKDWHVHDLRHTLATLGPGIGISRPAISLMLNHQLSAKEIAPTTRDIYAVKDWTLFSRETQPAWEAWERYIRGLVGEGGKVIAFRSGGS